MDHSGHDSTTLQVASDGRWIGVLLLVLPLTAYLMLARRQAGAKSGWSSWRTLGFVIGIGLLAVALWPQVAERAHDDLRVHMAQHLLIGMFAPLAIVLAAPMTLFLRKAPVAWGRTVSSIMRSRPVHVLSHPVTALILNIGGMYVLYATPLFAKTLTNPILHTVVSVHFFAAGYLFAWAIAGPDPAPGRPGIGMRLAVLLVSIGAHAALGKLMYAHLWPAGTPYDATEIQEAAMLMYYGGDVAELLLAITLFGTWYAHRRRRFDRGLPVVALR